MNDVERDRTVALAGVFQAAVLAKQLARRGYADELPLQASVRSVLITDAINTVSVYGGLRGVQLGLTAMREKMAGPARSVDLDIARYVLNLAMLQVRLGRNEAMKNEIAERIAAIKRRISEADSEEPTTRTYSELAQLYRDTISTLRPKIIVQGEHGYLSNTLIVDKVRTVLLAGVRSAFLWGQLGGTRWQLLLGRRRHLRNLDRIIAELPRIH